MSNNAVVNHGVQQGCLVAAQLTPDMTVSVASGIVINANTAAAVTAQNVTITAADPTLDRYDVISVNSAGTPTATAGTPSASPVPPESSDVVIANVLVYSQANALYTGTITSSVIQDVRIFIQAPMVANTLAYTFLSGAQTNVDPGTGKFGFDGATNGAIQHIYLNQLPATLPGSSAHVDTPATEWFSSFLTPYYLRIWSRQDPGRWWVGIVTSAANRTAGLGSAPIDVSVVPIAQSYYPVGAFPPFSSQAPFLLTDALDCIFEFNGCVPNSAVYTTASSFQNLLVADGTQTFLDWFHEIGSGGTTEIAGTGLLDIDAAPGGFVSGFDASGGYIEILGGTRPL